MFDNLLFKAICIIGLAIIIGSEHAIFARRWKRNELARRVMGVATVFALMLPLAILGMIDFDTWAWLFAAFGVAGAVTIGMYVWETENVNRRAREILSSDKAFDGRA